MKVVVDNRLGKDLKDIKDRKLKSEVYSLVEEMDEAENLEQISAVKFMKGYSGFFRIKIGNCRLGCKVLPDGSISVIRFQHRKEIYKVFP